MGARYYSSGLGRFVTPDWAAKPVTVPYANFGNPQSLNLYSYVKNSPESYDDPDGHEDRNGTTAPNGNRFYKKTCGVDCITYWIKDGMPAPQAPAQTEAQAQQQAQQQKQLSADDVSKAVQTYDKDKSDKNPARLIKALNTLGDNFTVSGDTLRAGAKQSGVKDVQSGNAEKVLGNVDSVSRTGDKVVNHEQGVYDDFASRPAGKNHQFHCGGLGNGQTWESGTRLTELKGNWDRDRPIGKTSRSLGSFGLSMRGSQIRNYRSGVIISLGLALAVWPVLVRSGPKSRPPTSAQEVTGAVQKYDEVLPKCSPDGRWLAFEYHEPDDPNYPHVGIMDLSQGSHPWHPLLEGKAGRHLYAGDLSWSPDSQWLALWTDYPEGRKSFWSDADIRIAKVNIYTREVVRLIDALPDGAHVGPTTAWLRPALIVFSGMMDENIYGVSERGGKPKKLVSVPSDKCGGGTNTLAVSPDEQSIAFAMDGDGDSQIAECNAIWIADLRTGNLRRVPTTGLHPLSPFWLDPGTILFSGENNNKPTGIYAASLNSQKVTRLLDGLYLTPFVCDTGKTLYFSWGPRLETKTPAGNDWPTFNDNYGFHIWKVPLRDVLR